MADRVKDENLTKAQPGEKKCSLSDDEKKDMKQKVNRKVGLCYKTPLRFGGVL